MAVVVVRLVVLPAAGFAAVVGLIKRGSLPSDDPLLQFVCLMMGVAPSAINLNTIATVTQCGQSEIATLLSLQYLAALVLMTANLMLCMMLVFPEEA